MELSDKNGIEMPEKIPDFIMVKLLQQEIGKLKSYIDELENIKSVKKQLNYKEQIKNLEGQNRKLKNMVNKLLVQINNYQEIDKNSI